MHEMCDLYQIDFDAVAPSGSLVVTRFELIGGKDTHVGVLVAVEPKAIVPWCFQHNMTILISGQCQGGAVNYGNCDEGLAVIVRGG